MLPLPEVESCRNYLGTTGHHTPMFVFCRGLSTLLVALSEEECIDPEIQSAKLGAGEEVGWPVNIF